MKQLILCEKPSVAQDFAKGLGNNFIKKDGYFENNKYIITWAYGHLCELKMPDDYDPKLKQWSLQTLPIFPQRFEYKIIKEGAKQFKIIKNLLNKTDVSSVVIATDCGREGELIARLILNLAGNRKPVYRFWTSEALQPHVIQREMQKLKPVKEFDRLYQSALARQWADWLVGINATRAVTVKNNNELFSVGRVQTAILALLVEREKEIKNFKPQKYWNVLAIFKRRQDEFKGVYVKQIQCNDNEEEVENETNKGINSQFAITKKDIAETIAKEVQDKTAVVKQVTSKISSEKPPLLFSLTTLQQEANILYGFTAEKTLEIAQSLYEKHLLSYPRTESQYLDPQYAGMCKRILEQIKSYIKFDISKCNLNSSNKRIFDLSKLTDHHALIPQGVPKSGLSEDERKVYDLVCRRFISAFYPDCKFRNTTVEIKVDNYYFIAKGRVLLDAGWREIYGGLRADEVLPELTQGEKLTVKNAEIVEKQTQPPPRYTDASILSVMANAHKVVTDKELKKILKENAGIGTPATRAQILSTLLKRKYLTKQGKIYIPTSKAFHLIDILDGEKVASVEYTALWEQELEKIARGEKKDISEFLTAVKEYVQQFVNKIKQEKQVYQGEVTVKPKKYRSIKRQDNNERREVKKNDKDRFH
ncbi:DNA topoisomerase 3 [Thermodesulfovibrio sp. TK110]